MIACGPPQRGEPCSPGEGPWISDETPDALFCTNMEGGYSDCEGPEDWYWSPSPQGYGGRDVCGCDGQTYEREPDFGYVGVPWRWYGSCEQPCAGVHWMGEWVFEGLEVPVAPQCTDCSLATFDDGVCVDPDGFELPTDCCRCAFSQVTADGVCERNGLELPPWCCPCLEDATVTEGECWSATIGSRQRPECCL